MGDFFLLSFCLKKGLHELTAFVFENTPNNSGFRMHGMGRYVVVASFFIRSTINDTWNLCPSDSACTHRTGFYRDIKRAVGKIFPASGVGCGCDGLHLGMSRNVAKCLSKVVGT